MNTPLHVAFGVSNCRARPGGSHKAAWRLTPDAVGGATRFLNCQSKRICRETTLARPGWFSCSAAHEAFLASSMLLGTFASMGPVISAAASRALLGKVQCPRWVKGR
jgi:hypothetical protein